VLVLIQQTTTLHRHNSDATVAQQSGRHKLIIIGRKVNQNGHNMKELKTQDWKTRERIGHGKPIKPKQPTHFLTFI